MNTKKALEYLKLEGITNSDQVLRRWIRQGKIQATLLSRASGYEIDEESLFAFIKEKQTKEEDITNRMDYQKGYKMGDKRGFKSGYRLGKLEGDDQLKSREKELIQKELYEETYIYNYYELEKKKQAPKKVLDFMYSLDLIELKIGVLGSWAMLEQTHDLIDIDRLPYPNRRLETRLRQGLVELMEEKLKEETRK